MRLVFLHACCPPHHSLTHCCRVTKYRRRGPHQRLLRARQADVLHARRGALVTQAVAAMMRQFGHITVRTCAIRTSALVAVAAHHDCLSSVAFLTDPYLFRESTAGLRVLQRHGQSCSRDRYCLGAEGWHGYKQFLTLLTHFHSINKKKTESKKWGQ